MKKNTIIVGDCVEEMSKMTSSSVDVVFADPPYNMQLNSELLRPNLSKVNAVDDDWDKFSSNASYDEFSYKWLKESHRVLKPDGTIWVMGSYHNIFRLGMILQNLGFWILNDIVWIKTNPMPNFHGTRFNNAHETLIWAAKSEKSKYFFHYNAMKALNGDLQMRSDWELPICTGHERLKGADGKKLHSTQKPESLLYRVLLSSTKAHDLILDPFAGTGTSLAVAKKMARNYIGIDREENYVNAAISRLKDIKTMDEANKIYLPKKREPRIAFGKLVENGIIKPGTFLSAAKGKFHAKIRIDGKIKCEDIEGSIHQVGAKVQNLPSCNGWNFWYSQNKLIDTFRQKFRHDTYENVVKH